MKCEYDLCDQDVFMGFGSESFCEFHFNVKVGELLDEMVTGGLISKTWDEGSKEYLYDLTDKGREELAISHIEEIGSIL
jgi:predicted transcriptional regulator